MLRLLIASPYPAMRAGLHSLLNDAGRGVVTVVGDADSVETCLDWAHGTQPHVIIFDLALDPHEELNGLWQLQVEMPGVAVLALSEANATARVLAALQAGARGCLPKTVTGAELLAAAQSAANGAPVLHPTSTAALLTQLRGDAAPVESLTPRETEVLKAVAGGQTNKAIALTLGISEHTVKFHLGSAMAKLNASSRAEAVAIAMRHGVLAV